MLEGAAREQIIAPQAPSAGCAAALESLNHA
jgi:hypothetical protein